MYILGINSIYHESSACLIKDGEILSAVEEERFNRIKHGKCANVENVDDLPVESIEYCLKEEGISLKDIEYIGFSYNIDKIHESFEMFGDTWGDGVPWQDEYLKKIQSIPNKLKEMGFEGEFKWIDHHTGHAASAFYPSGFEKAVTIVIDGIAETSTTSMFLGENHNLKLIEEIKYPNSIGFLWETISAFIGFSVYDAAKVMGLASYGNSQKYLDKFDKFVSYRDTKDSYFEIDNELTRFQDIVYEDSSIYYQELEKIFGIKKRDKSEEIEQVHQDIAASLQFITNEVIQKIIDTMYEKVDSENLCLAGGVALNCTTNRIVFENSKYKEFFVQPASNDAGTAIGVALYIYHEMLDNKKLSESNFENRAYLGPSFEKDEIKKHLDKEELKTKIEYIYSDDIEQKVAQLIADGNIIGFFQGQMEFGPRALGNRSLLADPRNPNMRDILNSKVKHREYFRPLAPSVLYEEMHNWFQIKKESSASDYMLMTYKVNMDKKSKIPAVVHTNDTSRVQSVKKEVNSKYHKLISEFFKITNVPILLNTSFNDSEPIVCTPEDAIKTFLKTKIDYLVLDNFLVSKI